MPADNIIVRHWQMELNIFHQNLLLLKEKITPEPVHDLRVAIKKLRSYLKLYVILFDKKDAEEMAINTKGLFSILGKHRNIETTRDLFLQLAHKEKTVWSSLLLYLQLLQDQLTPFCEQAIQQYERNELDILTKQLEQDFENANTDEIIHKVKEVIASSMENIKDDLKHFKKKSHLIRKRLKDVYYWAKVFEEQSLFTKAQLKALDKILDHLGNIQDHEVMISNLKNFRKTILPNRMAEYDRVKKLEIQAGKKKDILSEKANKATKELVQEK
jgi:CHAD domain-containing protein